jgi:hypothetical protein
MKKYCIEDACQTEILPTVFYASNPTLSLGLWFRAAHTRIATEAKGYDAEALVSAHSHRGV